MRSKTASGIMLTLLVTIMLTAALDSIPVLAETEGWFPCVPSCSVDLESWTATDQKTNVKVTLTLPQPCFRFDWGTVNKSGYDIWVDSEIWMWTGPCAQVITMASHTYNLGYLEEGYYTFIFMAWNETVKSINFTVGSAKRTFDIVLLDTHYQVSILSNSTVSNFNFNKTELQISFSVTGESRAPSYCNVTIPNNLLTGSPWTIKIDDTTITHFSERTNNTHIFLYFTYTHESPLQVTIKGTWVIPEFQSFLILPLFIITTLLTVVYVKKRKRNRD